MKNKVLICIDWFEPAYKAGGPIRSIKNLVELLKGDFDFYILTSDRDAGDTKPFDNIPLNCWIAKDGYSVFYLSKEKQNYRSFSGLLTERQYDRYYFNSLFSYKFTLLPLMILKKNRLDPKAVLAPRGMLGEGALQIKSTKKKLFINLSKVFGLYGNITWHASTKLEEAEIVEQFGEGAKIKVAQNVSQKLDSITSLEKGRKSRFIFLGRISPKKNLLEAISFFKDMRFDDKQAEFHIYGPIEDEEYWESCQEEILHLNSGVEVKYKGVLGREELYAVLSGYHFMLFPTKNENFGHNIAEALLCGVPVIISDQTPWRNLGAFKAGWDIPVGNKPQFIETIKRAIAMENAEYQQWRKASRKFAEERLFSEEVYLRNKELF